MMVGMDPKWLGKHGFKISDLAGLAPNSGQATTHFAVKKFRDDPRQGIVPVIDEYAPLYHVVNWKDIPPVVCITGEPPWEWKGRAEENRLLVASYCSAPSRGSDIRMPGMCVCRSRITGGR